MITTFLKLTAGYEGDQESKPLKIHIDLNLENKASLEDCVKILISTCNKILDQENTGLIAKVVEKDHE